jgi:hypothetical protein
MRLKKSSPCSLYRVRTVNALACRLYSSVSIFSAQREHNFRNEVYHTQFREKMTVKFVENVGKVTKW